MKKDIFDLLDVCGNLNNDFEQRMPLSSERIKELTMSKINRETEPRTRRISFFVLIAAVFIMTLTVSVFAAEIGATWFQQFFADKCETELSEEQIAFIEQNAVLINQSNTVDGYTLTVESAMHDERIIYVKLDLYAPVGVALPYGEDRYFETIGLYSKDGELVNQGWSMSEIMDEDKTDNHVEILMTFNIDGNVDTGFLLADGGVTLKLTDLYKSYGRYFSRKTEMMAEGTWQFDLQFATTQKDLWEHELISEPVPCMMVKDSTREETEILLTSVCLRALTIDVVYDYPEGADMKHLYWRGMKVVKKDGTVINVMPSGGSIHPEGDQVTGYMSLEPDTPIVLDEVAYIEFPGGTQIRVSIEE